MTVLLGQRTWVFQLALAWVVLQGVLAALWPFGSGSPFGGNVGAATGVVAVSAAAVWLLRRLSLSDGIAVPRRLVLAAGWSVSSALLLVVPGNLLMRLVFGRTGEPAFAQDVFVAIGGVLAGLATEAYRRQSGTCCRDCGRSLTAARRADGWTAPSRWATLAAYVAAALPVLGYSIPHMLWALHIPFGVTQAEADAMGFDPVMVFLITAPVVGAVLTVGLARRWGQVFPGWVPLVAGPRVPRWLVIVPPLLPALLIVQYGILTVRCVGAVGLGLTDTCFGRPVQPDSANWAYLATYPVFLLWGFSLLVATIGYYLATRPDCSSCRCRP